MGRRPTHYFHPPFAPCVRSAVFAAWVCQSGLASGADFPDKCPIYGRTNPEKTMRAKIFQPARSSMSSGMANTRKWILEFDRAGARDLDPLMGWTSSSDMQTQVQLEFSSREDALEYAKSKGIEVAISDPNKRGTNIRPGGYGVRQIRSFWCQSPSDALSFAPPERHSGLAHPAIFR